MVLRQSSQAREDEAELKVPRSNLTATIAMLESPAPLPGRWANANGATDLAAPQSIALQRFTSTNMVVLPEVAHWGLEREAGGIPARSRRCIRGRIERFHCPPGWEGFEEGESEARRPAPGVATSILRGQGPRANSPEFRPFCRRLVVNRWLNHFPVWASFG